jgi:putative glutamine amidotransferase
MNKPNIAIASLIYGDEYPPGANYLNAVIRAGGRPFLLGATSAQDAPYILDHFDGLLLTGGGDLRAETLGCPAHPKTEPVPPERDETELLLARAFAASRKPILAICRGEQVLNVAMGGTHCQHIFDRPEVVVAHQNRETRHSVNVVPGTLLHRIFGGAATLRVNSTHHQAVEALSDFFTLSAVSEDGVVEAYEHGGRILATQWHPERLLDEGMMPIWDWFIDACTKKEDATCDLA